MQRGRGTPTYVQFAATRTELDAEGRTHSSARRAL
eukprot:COSAG02_NODE_57014_length_282_cov_1.131148_1_plen_34_part_01